MRIELKTTKNVKLKTASKFVQEDIEIVPNLETKKVIPSETKQTITAAEGYSGIKEFEVDAIPNDYIGSSITKKGEETYTPTTEDQEIASGQYLEGKQTIKGDPNLIAENIVKDKTIFGITGTHEGAEDLTEELTAQTAAIDELEEIANGLPNSGGGSGSGGITPTGTLDIKENGKFDVKNYEYVNVNVEDNNPIKATTDIEMANLLTENNIGKVVKFIGTSNAYGTDVYYIIDIDTEEV